MTETLPSTGTFCLRIVSRSEREGVFTEIVYVSKLIAEKDSSGSPHGTLKEDKSFSETKQLEGENGALKEFFKDLYAGKGLHISIICADNINTNDIDQILQHKAYRLVTKKLVVHLRGRFEFLTSVMKVLGYHLITNITTKKDATGTVYLCRIRPSLRCSKKSLTALQR